MQACLSDFGIIESAYVLYVVLEYSSSTSKTREVRIRDRYDLRFPACMTLHACNACRYINTVCVVLLRAKTISLVFRALAVSE